MSLGRWNSIQMKKTELPTKVKIGAYTYKIKYVDDPGRFNFNGAYGDWGTCVNADATIYIKNDLPAVGTRDTIVHEILHAMWFVSGLYAQSEVTEEVVVCTQASQLIGVMQDNKKLFKYLSGAK